MRDMEGLAQSISKFYSQRVLLFDPICSSGVHGTTGNELAELAMMAVLNICLAWDGEAYALYEALTS